MYHMKKFGVIITICKEIWKLMYAIKNMHLGILLKNDVPYEEIMSYHHKMQKNKMLYITKKLWIIIRVCREIWCELLLWYTKPKTQNMYFLITIYFENNVTLSHWFVPNWCLNWFVSSWCSLIEGVINKIYNL